MSKSSPPTDPGSRTWGVPKLASELVVELGADRPGILASATEALANAGVNIDGCAEIEGILHLMVADPEAGLGALREAGFAARREEIVVARFTDRPGALAGVLRRMADAGLNVKFAYFGSRNRIVVGTGDPRRALELLAGG
jgi:hypothetical protein